MMIRTHQNDSLNGDVWYTSRVTEAEGEVVYGLLLSWPPGSVLEVGSVEAGPRTRVTLLGWPGGDLELGLGGEQLAVTITLPDITDTGLQWAWALKFVHLENGGNALH